MEPNKTQLALAIRDKTLGLIDDYQIDWTGNLYPIYRGGGKVVVSASWIKTIRNISFASKAKITDVELPVGLEVIDDCCFEFAGNMRSIKIPEGVTSIGSFAFRGCGKLESVVLPENLRILHQSCFALCNELKYIRIPPNVVKIECFVFQCTSLERILIPKAFKHHIELPQKCIIERY